MTQKRRLPRGYTWFLLVFALVWFGYTAYALVESYLSRNWETTQGKITSIKINESAYERGGTKYHYFAAVTYEYYVNNKTYLGSDFSSMPIVYNSAKAMHNLLEERGIAKGKSVSVYYKPDNFKKAVLIVDHKRSTAMQWVILVFLLMCIFGAILELKGKLSA